MKRALLIAVALGLTLPASSPAQERSGSSASGGSEPTADGATFRIAGIVVDAMTGTPVAGASVLINMGDNAMEATAGGDGRFVFDGLKAGKYPLYAMARGYVREGYNQHGTFLTAVVTGNGLDSEHVVFKLHPEAVLYGKVTDERGEPVRRAQVMLLSGDEGWGQRRMSMRSQIQTNDLGEYRFAHLRAGKYYVAVQAHPWYAQTGLRYQPEPVGPVGGIMLYAGPSRMKPDPALDVVYPVTFYPGVTDENVASAIELNWDESEQADIALQAVPSVHILVTNLPADEKGNVSYGIGASAKVMGTMEYGVPVTSGQIAPGEYEIAGLPPGEVTLHLNEVGGHPDNSRTLEASVNDGGTVDARGSGTRVAVSGKAIFPAGVSAEMSGQVVLADAGGRNRGTQLEKDGTFAFPAVRPGTYRVTVNMQDQKSYASRVAANGAKTNGREVTIAGGENVNLTIAMGLGFGQVMGFAKQDGKPTAGVMVILVPESGQNMEEDTRMDQSDSDGTFTLARIIPGKYELMAIADGWDLEWAKPGALTPYLAKGQVLQIGANEKKEVTVAVQGKAADAARQ